jgi:hypothetical protein
MVRIVKHSALKVELAYILILFLALSMEGLVTFILLVAF